MLKKHYRKGTTIFVENSYAGGVYLINKGKVEISQQVKHNKKEVIAIYGENHLFGEMALISKINTRIATAIAIEKTCCYYLTRKEFYDALSKTPKLLREVLENLVLTIYIKNKKNISLLPKCLENKYHTHPQLIEESLINNTDLQQDISNSSTFIQGIYRVLCQLAFK